MAPITQADIKDFLFPFLEQLPAGSRLFGRVVAPSLPDSQCHFYCWGGPISRITLSPIDDMSLFNIGSTTKTFTTTILARGLNSQIPQGSTVGDYLGFMNFPSGINNITLTDIAHYASGFTADNTGPSWLEVSGDAPLRSITSLTEFQKLINDYSGDAHPLPQNTPGSSYSYSNLAYGLLGLCLAGVNNTSTDVGQMYNTALKNMFTQCGLHMPNTTIYQCLTSDQQQGMLGYNGSHQVTLGDLSPNTVMYAGSGAITTTIEDMGQWLVFNMGRLKETDVSAPILAQTSINQLSAPSGSDVDTGLGWFVSALNGLPGRVYKNGGVNGFSSFMSFKKWADLDGGAQPSDTGLVLLANFRNCVSPYPAPDSSLDATFIGSRLMARVMGGGQADPATVVERSFDP